MKQLFSFLTIGLLLISCEINYFESDIEDNKDVKKQTEGMSQEDTNQLTKKQLRYAQRLIDDLPSKSFVTVQWRDNKTLDMYFDAEFLREKEGSDEHLLHAKKLATEYADDALVHTDRDVCVYIYNHPSPEPLAKSCLQMPNYDHLYEADANFFEKNNIDKNEINNSPGKKITQKQREFAHILLYDNYVVESNWQNPLFLDVTFDTPLLAREEGSLNYMRNAMLKAEEIGIRGLEYTGKDLCVRIFNKPDTRRITRTCFKVKDK